MKKMVDTQVVEHHSIINSDAGRKYRSYSMTDRLKAVSMSESGMGSVCIGREMGIDSSLIRGWIRRYKKDGINGLKPKSHRNGICGSVMPQVAMIGLEQETSTRIDGKKGFVHFVDNPVLVRSMVNTLSAYGLPMENIVVGDDARTLAHSMAAGGTLVLNSLFDLSCDFAKILYVIEDLLRAGITIVSISDKGLEINPGYTDSLGLVSILKNYLLFSVEDVNPAGDDTDRLLGYQVAQSIPRTYHNKKEQALLAALDLYQKGHTMAYAVREAGCSYNAFRYWLKKKMSVGLDDIQSSQDRL